MIIARFFGRYYLRTCPSCHDQIGMIANPVDVCPRCGRLLSAERGFGIALLIMMLLAITLGFAPWANLGPIGVMAVPLGLCVLIVTLPFMATTVVGGTIVDDPQRAVRAVKFCYLTSQDYDAGRREAVRHAVTKGAKTILDVYFPPGKRVEYQNQIYSVVEVGDALTLRIQAGRDCIDLQSRDVCKVRSV